MVEDAPDGQGEQQEAEVEVGDAELAQMLLHRGVPEIYTDSFSMAGSAYTVSLIFAVRMGTVLKQQAVVHMSPIHAKVMAILFKRQLKRYEEAAGEITVPEQLLRDKDINLDRDWNDA